MDTLLIILPALLVSGVLIIIACVVYFFIWRELKSAKGNSSQDQSFLLIQNQLQEIAKANQDLKLSNEQLKSDLTEKIQDKIGQSQKMMSDSVQTQLQESQKLIKDITAELGAVKSQGEQVIGFTEQLKSLQDILQNTKQRGALGEYFLETTIKNILPPDNYEFQYSFKDGTIVDAVVKLPDGLVPIDSKFSLENYNKLISENNPENREALAKRFKEDLKLRINETAKYIKPREGTLDFAFMFIPSEGIYYDLLISKIGVVNTQNFLEYAYREKKVIVVSPTTLHAYLQTVIQGLNSLKIEKQATQIIKQVGNLQKHLNSFETYHTKLGNSLSTVVNQYNQNSKAIKMLSNDALKITGEGEKIEIAELTKPEKELED